MPSLQSSVISRAEYEPGSRTLELTFRSGRTYTLRGVPAHHYSGLLNAPSAGRYFNLYFRGNY